MSTLGTGGVVSTESPYGQPFEPDLGHASEGKCQLRRRILYAPHSLVGCGFFFTNTWSLPLRLIINGEEREIQSSVNITELLLELEIKGSHLAVAVNSQVIPRLSYEKTLLSQDDQIEIVTAVGGGK